MLRAEQIYEAVFDEEAFAKLPALLAESVGGRSCLINWVHSDGEVENFACSYFGDAFIAGYRETYAAKDLWVSAAMAPALQNRVFNVSEIVRPEIWDRSEIYNELIRPLGDDTSFCIGGTYATPWGLGILGVNRGRKAGQFAAEELAALRAPSEHLRRVLMVRGEIANHRRGGDLARRTLDSLGAPAITVHSDQTASFVNAAAEAVLRRGDGLVRRRGFLQALRDEDSRRLSLAIAEATNPRRPRSSSFRITRPLAAATREGQPYQVTVTPLPSISGPTQALLLFRDPDSRDRTLPERLRAFYGLTGAEARLAVELADGATLSEAAAGRDVRESTVRSQLKSLMAKMHCTRQAEVTAVVASLPPLRAPDA